MSQIEYDDPVYRHTRREACSILVLWGLCFAWVILYCRSFAYEGRGAEPLATVFGMPAWVFWGVAIPWLVASMAGLAMCLWLIQEDDLGESEGLTSDQTREAPNRPEGPSMPTGLGDPSC